MEHLRIKKNDNEICYEVSSDISVNIFLAFMQDVAASFGVDPEFISIPEAEVIKINLPAGFIYAKYDLMYGVEIFCKNISSEQQCGLERMISDA